MLDTFKNLLELQRYFTTEKICVEYLEQQRWGNTPACPHCGTIDPYKTVTRSKRPELARTFDYRCRSKECFKKFNALSKTIFENTKIDLKTWYAAIYIGTAHKKGISSLQLSRDLGITQKSAWFVNHRVREMLKAELPTTLKGTVQVDESYFGGKTKNKHQSKRQEIIKSGKSLKEKIPVVGLLEKDGKVIAFVTENTGAKTLKGLMYKHVEENSTVVTDGYKPYKGIKKHYNHVVVKGDTGRFVIDNKFHTQNIENFWSIFKRGYIGIYHYMSKKHLQRYCEEFSYRYNTRGITDAERFAEAIKRADGRLTYNRLIGKDKIVYKESDMMRPGDNRPAMPDRDTNDGLFYAMLKNINKHGRHNPKA